MKRNVVQRKKVAKPKKKRLTIRKIPKHLSRERRTPREGGDKYTKRAKQ